VNYRLKINHSTVSNN